MGEMKCQGFHRLPAAMAVCPEAGERGRDALTLHRTHEGVLPWAGLPGLFRVGGRLLLLLHRGLRLILRTVAGDAAGHGLGQLADTEGGSDSHTNGSLVPVRGAVP